MLTFGLLFVCVLLQKEVFEITTDSTISSTEYTPSADHMQHVSIFILHEALNDIVHLQFQCIHSIHKDLPYTACGGTHTHTHIHTHMYMCTYKENHPFT